jgi:hypothetical protein
MDDPAPVRINLVGGSSEALNRRFISGFFAFAILFAGAAFYRPAIQAFAVGFPIYLVLWKLSLRHQAREAWTMTIAVDRLEFVSTREARIFNRAEGARTVIRRQNPGAELNLVDSAGNSAFRLKIPKANTDSVETALLEAGWTVSGSQ